MNYKGHELTEQDIELLIEVARTADEVKSEAERFDYGADGIHTEWLHPELFYDVPRKFMAKMRLSLAKIKAEAPWMLEGE